MRASSSKQFLIGLPSAGKTTFLAALWHVVETGEVQGALKLSRLHGEKEYLNKIRNLWADAHPLERTSVSGEQIVSMLLEETQGESTTEVFFPDMSGESFELQWRHRRTTKQYAQLLQDTAGGLLLIHPEYVRPETLISDVERIVRRTAEGANQPAIQTEPETRQDGEDRGADAGSYDAYDSGLAPTQAKLVDLLQSVALISKQSPIRLAVVISAWDRVIDTEGDQVAPIAWVAKRLSLLKQYLTANSEIFDVRFFGVSAQGGELSEAEELRKVPRPSDRIIVVEEDLSKSHDISKPVRWVMK